MSDWCESLSQSSVAHVCSLSVERRGTVFTLEVSFDGYPSLASVLAKFGAVYA